MNVNSANKKRKRIFYFDALRALAIICVIAVHTFTLTRYLILSEYVIPTWNWILTDSVFNSMRIGVDLFLLLSGALSLGREWNIKPFLMKRIPRIVEPFVFWNVIFISVFIILSFYGIINVISDFGFSSMLQYIFDVFTAQAKGFRPNWFYWMILDTYLI